MTKMLKIYKQIYMHLHNGNEIQHTHRNTMLRFAKAQYHLQWRPFNTSKWDSGNIEEFWEDKIPDVFVWWVISIEAELDKDDSLLHLHHRV